MKRVVQHAKSCKRKSNQAGGQAPGCPICKQLIALCCYHAKHCTEAKCPVPYCINIKHKLKQQQLQQRLQQAQILKRRIASMASMSQPAQPASQQQAIEYSPSSSSQQTVSPTFFTSLFARTNLSF
jgi:E1A/CREB-binding protein